MKKEKERLLKWEDLPSELQNYFLIRLGLSICFFVILIIFAALTRMWETVLAAALIYFLYFITKMYLYIQIKRNKVLKYEGICEKKNVRNREINPGRRKKALFTFYGSSDIIVAIEDAKFIIPVGSGFDAEEGYLIRTYALSSDIIKKNSNTYLINSPILVNVMKT